VLHSGEGVVQTVRWSGTLIAWANELGVKVGVQGLGAKELRDKVAAGCCLSLASGQAALSPEHKNHGNSCHVAAC
jgi:hypothetical protein